MSGICGIYSPRDPSQATAANLHGMLSAIAHRGTTPRSFVDEQLGIALGQRGTPGDGPHPDPSGWYEDHDIAISFDGAPFGVADSVAAAARSGAAALGRLGGHFGVAVWNKTNRELSLLRDPLGTKPLYYWHSDSVLVFASELKAILAYPAVGRRVDRIGLTACLTFGYVPAPRSMFEGIRKVFPGEALKVDDRGRLTSETGWTMPDPEASDAGISTLASNARQRLLDCCARHVGDTKRVGMFVSGGVDSTIVLGILKLLGVPEIHTFALGFRGSHLDPRLSEDLRWSEQIAKRFEAKHHPVVIDVDDGGIPDLERTWRQFDEPILTPNAHSKQFLSQAARRHDIRLCVTGLGAENIFGSVGSKRFAKVKKRIAAGASEIEAMLPRYQRIFTFEEQRELLAEPLEDPQRVALDIMRRFHEDVQAEDVGDRMVVSSPRMMIAEKSVAIQDRCSAMNGVEVVHPFRDPDLLGFGRTIPVSLRRGTSPATAKAVLKQAFADVLPEDVVNRRKIGYPTYYWNHGELDQWKDLVLSPAAVQRAGIFREEAVARMIESDAVSAKKSAGKRTWALLAVQAWSEFHVRGDVLPGIERVPETGRNEVRSP